MPRQARLDAPGTLHHVMLRGIERRAIVTDDADRHEFVRRLGASAMQSRTSVYGWALLTNHAHLLLRSGPDGLPRLMRRFLTGYAQAYNRRHQRHGHLFQNRYKSIVCEEDRYFVELLRYIHLNPLRARLVRTLSELERYPWSGHGVLLGEIAGSWQEREWVLSWFGKTTDSAIQAYREFVAEGVGQERRPELVGGRQVRSGGSWSVVRGRSRQKVGDERILGGKIFVATVLREAEERIRRQLAVRRNQSGVSEAIERVCRQAGVSARELQAGSRRRSVSKIRALLAQRLVAEFGLSLAEVARQLGVSLSSNCQEFTESPDRIIPVIQQRPLLTPRGLRVLSSPLCAPRSSGVNKATTNPTSACCSNFSMIVRPLFDCSCRIIGLGFICPRNQGRYRSTARDLAGHSAQGNQGEVSGSSRRIPWHPSTICGTRRSCFGSAFACCRHHHGEHRLDGGRAFAPVWPFRCGTGRVIN